MHEAVYVWSRGRLSHVRAIKLQEASNQSAVLRIPPSLLMTSPSKALVSGLCSAERQMPCNAISLCSKGSTIKALIASLLPCSREELKLKMA